MEYDRNNEGRQTDEKHNCPILIYAYIHHDTQHIFIIRLYFVLHQLYLHTLSIIFNYDKTHIIKLL